MYNRSFWVKTVEQNLDKKKKNPRSTGTQQPPSDQ